MILTLGEFQALTVLNEMMIAAMLRHNKDLSGDGLQSAQSYANGR